MANINTIAKRIYSATATDSSGVKIGYISGETKAAQNDTITITNADSIELVIGLVTDTAGASEGFTIDGNEITLTSATIGTVSGMIIYK